MPIHDWTRVPSGIFHHFHGMWISELCKSLNAGLLPTRYYALLDPFPDDTLGIVIAPPKARFHERATPTYMATWADVPRRWRQVIDPAAA